MGNIGIDLIDWNAEKAFTIFFYKPTVELTFYFITFMSYFPKIIELLLRKYVVSSNIQRKIDDLIH